MAYGATPSGLALLRWIIAFFVICSVFMLLRLWAARLTKRRFYADDAFSIIGFASTISQGSVTIWAVFHGMGAHEVDLPIEDVLLLGKIFQLPCAITWLFGTVCVKLAMLFLYIRVFSTAQFKRWTYALMGVVVCYFVAFLIVFMTNCIPLSNLWDPVPGGWCRELTTEEYTSVVFNLVIDLSIVILPMPVLWQLKLPFRDKIFVSMMFGMGIITIAVMCWRLEATTESLRDPDFPYHLSEIGLISCLELWLGVIVNCMPTLGPLIQTYVKPAINKVKSSVSSGSQYSRRQIRLEQLSNSHSRKKYQNLDSSHDMSNSFALRTECVHDPTAKIPEVETDQRVIHVRRDIESQDES
ncbi:hypothetical protein F5Y06DRAFT_268049 [Hypoxylon sp. FL0890]|nr:hypothetical protein F5Y06DRAFT_268049 [Hypoxylon sp. FL0890]